MSRARQAWDHLAEVAERRGSVTVVMYRRALEADLGLVDPELSEVLAGLWAAKALGFAGKGDDQFVVYGDQPPPTEPPSSAEPEAEAEAEAEAEDGIGWADGAEQIALF